MLFILCSQSSPAGFTLVSRAAFHPGENQSDAALHSHFGLFLVWFGPDLKFLKPAFRKADGAESVSVVKRTAGAVWFC